MRLFFNLFVLRPLLTQKAFQETRLFLHRNIRLQNGLSEMPPQVLSGLKSIKRNNSYIPVTCDLIAIRDHCHSLEELDVSTIYNHCDEEHYPIYLDIVKANPNLTRLEAPWSNELVDIMTKNNQKLQHIECYHESSNITLRHVTELFTAIPSLIKFQSRNNFDIDLNEHSVRLYNVNNSFSEKDFKSFVNVMGHKVHIWRLNYGTDAFIHEILRDKETAANITHFNCEDVSKITLQPLKKLFAACTKLYSVSFGNNSLTSEEFDELFALIPDTLDYLSVSGVNLTMSNVMKILQNTKKLNWIVVKGEDKVKEDLEALEQLKTVVKEHPSLWRFNIYSAVSNTTNCNWWYNYEKTIEFECMMCQPRD